MSAPLDLVAAWDEAVGDIEGFWTMLSEPLREGLLLTAYQVLLDAVSSLDTNATAPGSHALRLAMLCPELKDTNIGRFAKGDLLVKWIEVRLKHVGPATAQDAGLVRANLPAADDEAVDALVTMRQGFIRTFIQAVLLVLKAAIKDVMPDSAPSAEEAASSAAVAVGAPVSTPAPADDPDGPIIDPSRCHPSPFEQFRLWFDEATALGKVPAYGMPMTLATCTPDGYPSARIVLLKSYSDAGFVFFTNHTSRKGGELESNPRAALVFFWPDIYTGRQIRVEGIVCHVPAADSDEYFASRPESARVGCWASPQSQVIPSRDHLLASVAVIEARHGVTGDGNAVIPRPPHWGGYIVKPTSIEFWRSGGRSRLHDRVTYRRKADKGAAGGGWTFGDWEVVRLAP